MYYSDECPRHHCKDRRGDPDCHPTCYDRYIPWCEREDRRKEREKNHRRSESDVNGVLNKRKSVGHAIGRKKG